MVRVKCLLGNGLVLFMLLMMVSPFLIAKKSNAQRLVSDPPTDQVNGYTIKCNDTIIEHIITTGPVDFRADNPDCVYSVAAFSTSGGFSDYILANDFDQDGDIDGQDLVKAIEYNVKWDYFSKVFGRAP